MTQNRAATTYVDRLGREQEVELISSLLVDQATARTEHSFVLALDSHYGAGKSFFLELLADNLSEKHPVARVDAWADDSGNEPSVSIMAAIEEALEPYLERRSAKGVVTKLDIARRNILPILAKGVGGAVSKATAHYVGDVALEGISEILREQGESISSEATALGQGAEAGIQAVGDRLTELADQHAKSLITEYRKRKRSRLEFKKAMAQMVAALVPGNVSKVRPLIVIIDELDRCRPDYAIKVLEEIKHFFDIPGVAFVLAIHRDQLSASVRSIYGDDFKSDAYLLRFFDWSMSLRPRGMAPLLTDQMFELGIDWTRLRSPSKHHNTKTAEGDHEDYIAFIFRGLDVNAREAKRIMRAMALFFQTWHPEVPVELTVLIPKLVALVRGEPVDHSKLSSINLAEYSSQFRSGNSGTFYFNRLYDTLVDMSEKSILNTRYGSDGATVAADYLRDVFSEEYAIIAKNERPENGPWSVPLSLISSYDSRIRLLDRLTD